jgi:hypothetical protein
MSSSSRPLPGKALIVKLQISPQPLGNLEIPMPPRKRPLRRTEWAERHVEEFLSLPLIMEFVFRSPQTLDGTQREVGDFLIAHGNFGFLISQKCQEDPSSRDSRKQNRGPERKRKKPSRNFGVRCGLPSQGLFGAIIRGEDASNFLTDCRRLIMESCSSKCSSHSMDAGSSFVWVSIPASA